MRPADQIRADVVSLDRPGENPHDGRLNRLARDVPGLLAEVERLTTERNELRTALVELAPTDDVLVEGSFFSRADLPQILGNFMRSSADYRRQAKEAQIVDVEAKNRYRAERDALRDAVTKVIELCRTRGTDRAEAYLSVEVSGILRAALALDGA